MQTVSITIKGKVQGVFFRKYTKQMAEKLHLSGFVLNKSNGDVHAEATGSEANIKEFISWCHQGSPASKVTEVIISEVPLVKYSGFTIRY